MAAAFAAVLGLWLLFASTLWSTHRWLSWPTSATGGSILYLATIVGLAPLALLTLEYVARRGASVGTRWFNFDFTKGVEASLRPAVELPVGIAFEGQPITDSSVIEIHRLLNEAAASDVGTVDLKDGTGWWTTRLVALCAGAAQSGRPNAIVFVGRESTPGRSVDGAFLGWVTPKEALDRLLERRSELGDVYDRAQAIGGQVTLFGQADLRLRGPGPPQPNPSPSWVPPTDPAPPVAEPGAPRLPGPVESYAMNPMFQRLGRQTFLRVFLDLLGRYEASLVPAGPERVTVGFLQDAFGGVLHNVAVDTRWPAQRQLEAFLESSGDYIALLDGGTFHRLLPRRIAESAILRQIVIPPEPPGPE